MRRAAAGLLALAAACGRSADDAGATVGPGAAEPGVARYEGATMGSSWHATVVHRAEVAPPAPAELQAVLDEVDRLMSTWKPESELMRFNAWRPAGAVESLPVSPWTADAVREALEAAAETGGAFDPTVLPLVDLWGFGAGGARPSEPAEAEIAAARARVDWRRIAVRENALAKSAPDAALDLSGSAPGFAADRICELLDARGFPDHLVEIGGEVRVGGLAPGGRPWRIGIEQPLDDAAQGEALSAAIEVASGAVATSGDYRKFRRAPDGTRLSHEIDPRSGRPIAHGLASVTVLAPTCGRADALATAFMVLGTEAALALAERLPDVEAYLIERRGAGFRVARTGGFPAPAD